MILCNPHNPVGKIWDRDTLEKIGELCAKHFVTVISDEIHCDLTDPGKEYVPFASVSKTCADISVTCVAPTKTFNIAGLNTAAIIVPNENLRHKMWRALNTDEVAEPNAFAQEVVIAAYEKGGDWLDELRKYIYANKCYVREYIEKNIPGIKVVDSEATYLLWLDCSQVSESGTKLSKHIRKTTGLYMSPGIIYGRGGEQFIRLNVACPRELVCEGMERLKEGVATWKGR
jgi:cystathionine beta-lyase